MKQFEIWWADLPAPAGRRPVLLLSRSASYGYLARVLVAEVTTTVRNIPQEVRLGRRDGLPRGCVVNLDAARTIPKVVLTERLAALPWGRHQDVKRAFGHVVAWPELTAL